MVSALFSSHSQGLAWDSAIAANDPESPPAAARRPSVVHIAGRSIVVEHKHTPRPGPHSKVRLPDSPGSSLGRDLDWRARPLHFGLSPPAVRVPFRQDLEDLVGHSPPFESGRAFGFLEEKRVFLKSNPNRFANESGGLHGAWHGWLAEASRRYRCLEWSSARIP